MAFWKKKGAETVESADTETAASVKEKKGKGEETTNTNTVVNTDALTQAAAKAHEHNQWGRTAEALNTIQPHAKHIQTSPALALEAGIALMNQAREGSAEKAERRLEQAIGVLGQITQADANTIPANIKIAAFLALGAAHAQNGNEEQSLAHTAKVVRSIWKADQQKMGEAKAQDDAALAKNEDADPEAHQKQVSRKLPPTLKFEDGSNEEKAQYFIAATLLSHSIGRFDLARSFQDMAGKLKPEGFDLNNGEAVQAMDTDKLALAIICEACEKMAAAPGWDGIVDADMYLDDAKGKAKTVSKHPVLAAFRYHVKAITNSHIIDSPLPAPEAKKKKPAQQETSPQPAETKPAKKSPPTIKEKANKAAEQPEKKGDEGIQIDPKEETSLGLADSTPPDGLAATQE